MATVLSFIVDVVVDNMPSEDELKVAEKRLNTYVNGVVLDGFETAGVTYPKSTQTFGHRHADNSRTYNACGVCLRHADINQGWNHDAFDISRYIAPDPDDWA